jgi:hypothetical protein
VGLAGLISLVHQVWGCKPVKIATGVFCGLMLLAMVPFVYFWVGICTRRSRRVPAMDFTLLWPIFTLPALSCDWVLGIMADNLLGVPSGDNIALYWTYFASKRLTMFSI